MWRLTFTELFQSCLNSGTKLWYPQLRKQSTWHQKHFHCRNNKWGEIKSAEAFELDTKDIFFRDELQHVLHSVVRAQQILTLSVFLKLQLADVNCSSDGNQSIEDCAQYAVCQPTAHIQLNDVLWSSNIFTWALTWLKDAGRHCWQE